MKKITKGRRLVVDTFTCECEVVTTRTWFEADDNNTVIEGIYREERRSSRQTKYYSTEE